MSESNPDALLDQAGAASRLGKSEGTLENWRWKGYGPRYVKIGGAVRYRQSDLDYWLNQQTIDPANRAA